MRRTPADKLHARLDRLRARLARRNGPAILWQALGKAYIERTYTLGTFEYAPAEAAYRRALDLDATDPFTHLFLGNLFYARHLYLQALHWFENGRRLLPDQSIAYFLIADTHVRLGHFDLADEFFRKAVAVDPADEDARRRLDAWLAGHDRPPDP
jgi:tetratricopeptide (TPR) repeat protein